MILRFSAFKIKFISIKIHSKSETRQDNFFNTSYTGQNTE